MLRNLSPIEKILLSVLGPCSFIVLFVILRSVASSPQEATDPRILPLLLIMVGLIFISVAGLAFYQYRKKSRRRKRSHRRLISTGYKFVE